MATIALFFSAAVMSANRREAALAAVANSVIFPGSLLLKSPPAPSTGC
jgi:hypothetical protein